MKQDVNKLVTQALSAQDIRKALISLVEQSYALGYADGMRKEAVNNIRNNWRRK